MKASDKIKILAMEFCSNSKISKETKIKHLEYIKEADPYVCLGYILDGKFYNLNESGKKEIKERFLKEQGIRIPSQKEYNRRQFQLRNPNLHKASAAVGRGIGKVLRNKGKVGVGLAATGAVAIALKNRRNKIKQNQGTGNIKTSGQR